MPSVMKAAAKGAARSATATGMSTPEADLWADLLLACIVVFVVLAPSFLFRVKTPAAPTAKKKL